MIAINNTNTKQTMAAGETLLEAVIELEASTTAFCESPSIYDEDGNILDDDKVIEIFNKMNSSREYEVIETEF